MESCRCLRALALLATITILLGTARSAAAGPIMWNLQNVTFDDGGIATGTFTTDNGTITNWDITATTGAALGSFTYNPSNSDSYGPLPDVHFITLDNLRYLRLQVSASLSTPGTYPMLISSPPTAFKSYECGNNPTCGIIREVTAGEVESVPEPPAAVLFATGLLGVGLVRLFRRQAGAADHEVG